MDKWISLYDEQSYEIIHYCPAPSYNTGHYLVWQVASTSHITTTQQMFEIEISRFLLDQL